MIKNNAANTIGQVKYYLYKKGPVTIKLISRINRGSDVSPVDVFWSIVTLYLLLQVHLLTSIRGRLCLIFNHDLTTKQWLGVLYKRPQEGKIDQKIWKVKIFLHCVLDWKTEKMLVLKLVMNWKRKIRYF